jgi:hypothetical protein
MSSHHFVKEGQEPALLILSDANTDLVGPMLEWAPLVMVADIALESIQGIKLDVVLASKSGLENLKIPLSDQGPLKILVYDTPEEILDLALNYLISCNHFGVSIITNDPQWSFKSVDKFIGQIEIVFITGAFKWVFAKKGKYEKWLPADSILKISDQLSIQHTTGLNISEGQYSVAHDGIVKITGSRSFWVGEAL